MTRSRKKSPGGWRRAGILCPAILLLWLWPSSLLGQEAPKTSGWREALAALGDRDDALHFRLRLTQGYDDNIRLEPTGPQEGSWKSTISPTLRIETLDDQTYLEVAYTPTFIFYYPADDQFDLNQHGNLNFRHNLSPRDIVGLEEIFIGKQDPEDIRPVSEPTQRNADYIRNHLTLVYRHDLSRKYALIGKYRNERDDYSRSSGLEGLDFWSNNGEIFFRAKVGPLCHLECFYRYRHTDYDTYNSDYRSHLGGLELRYAFSENIEARVEGGYEARTYTGEKRLDSPYAKLSLQAKLHRDLEANLRYWHKIEDTFELTYLGYRGQGVDASLSYRFAPRLFISLAGLAEFAYFPSILEREGEKKSAREHYLRGIISLTYEVQTDMFIELGYDRTHNSSDFENASYSRNQVFLRLGLEL